MVRKLATFGYNNNLAHLNWKKPPFCEKRYIQPAGLYTFNTAIGNIYMRIFTSSHHFTSSSPGKSHHHRLAAHHHRLVNTSDNIIDWLIGAKYIQASILLTASSRTDRLLSQSLIIETVHCINSIATLFLVLALLNTREHHDAGCKTRQV